jgi:hypothetical protein
MRVYCSKFVACGEFLFDPTFAVISGLTGSQLTTFRTCDPIIIDIMMTYIPNFLYLMLKLRTRHVCIAPVARIVILNDPW